MEMITRKEVAEMMGCSINTVTNNFVKTGALSYHIYNRYSRKPKMWFKRSDVEALINRCSSENLQYQ